MVIAPIAAKAIANTAIAARSFTPFLFVYLLVIWAICTIRWRGATFPRLSAPNQLFPSHFYKLGIIGSVKEDVLPLETVNKYIFSFLIRYYRQNLSEYYDNIRITNDLTYSRFIAYVAKYHVSKLKNDELNIPEAEKKFFRDFKDAKIVKYTLDRIE